MMNTDQFLLAQQAYREILDEIHPGHTSEIPVIETEDLKKDFPRLGPLPEATLPLGIAGDGLPVLLNLDKPAAGPLLIASGKSSGKTDFLKSLAINLAMKDASNDIQFGVLTNFPEEWQEVEPSPDSMGIWPAYHQAAGDYLSRLTSWSEALAGTQQYILLLIDDLDLMSNMNLVCRHALRWLLKHGPENHIWPIVTMDTDRLCENKSWLEYFPTIIYGASDQQNSAHSSPDRPVNPDALVQRSVFMYKLAEGWLVFSILNP